ncbi:MAG: N-acetyltransferase [Burkholderiaceae bacterium]|nr:N-acetyltransferase [Burkholderiaceae bacterium]
MNGQDYRTRIVGRLAGVPERDWDALIDPEAPGAVFVSHAWLGALEASGCVGPGTGWRPQHVLISDDAGGLVGAAPLYRKTHSYGEYVFDWAWADAYQRHGLDYYPKLVCAVPFTPVQGPRLLGPTPGARRVAARELLRHAVGANVSSLHVLFPDTPADEALAPAGLMRRTGVQFQWRNAGYRDFDDFLAALTQPKRKKIRAERRKAAGAGIRCRRLLGEQIDESHWRFFHACYCSTYAAHHSTPYLNLEFFLRIGKSLSDHCVMVVAERNGSPTAASLLIKDRTRLYGRYWGAVEPIAFQHFEVAYYQAIETAIELGLQTIEGGAQGEHKMARGFEPVETGSWHWLAEPAFADAVERYLAREGQMMSGYLDELDDRSPYRANAVTTPPPTRDTD